MIPDETAYRRYLDGEEKAANLLLKKHGDAQTRYINGYIKDIHEAEDLMIEAFAQIFAKERPISSEGSFKAYVYKTTRNLSLRYKQKRRALGTVCMAVCLLLVVDIGACMPSLMAGVTEGGVVHASSAASLIGSHTALGYILMRLLAFLFGVCVTVLLYRLRRRNERRHKEDSTDEL